MSAVPLDVQRRLEKRWAARLLRPNGPSEAYRRPESRPQLPAPAKATTARAERADNDGRTDLMSRLRLLGGVVRSAFRVLSF
jgi:hypothetical protein